MGVQCYFGRIARIFVTCGERGEEWWYHMSCRNSVRAWLGSRELARALVQPETGLMFM